MSIPTKEMGRGGCAAAVGSSNAAVRHAFHAVDPGVAGIDASLSSRARVHNNYHARLALVDPPSNADEYCILQVLVDEHPPKKKKARRRWSVGKKETDAEYYALSRSGRTGTPGRTSLEGPFDDERKPKKSFEKEFKSKTDVKWDRAVPGNGPKPGRYMYLHSTFVVNRVSADDGNDFDAHWYYYLQSDPSGRRMDGWHEYDIENDREVEQLYSTLASNKAPRLAQRIVTSKTSGFQYLVDLSSMRQKNTQTGRTRPIGRTNNGCPPQWTPTGVEVAAAAPAATSGYSGAPKRRVTATQTLDYMAPLHLTSGIPHESLRFPPPEEVEVTYGVSGSSTPVMEQDCAICHESLRENTLVALRACNHFFHSHCIVQAYRSKPQCPICRVPIGKPQGKSPSGTMTAFESPTHCFGYFDVDTIIITYSLPPGLQRSYHDHPGKPYGGKYVTAYLPYNTEGKDLLKRLKFAFLHGLSFTVGTSITTGLTDQCTWASIHHKTSPSGGVRTYGFPDPNYFGNCNSELDGLGVPLAQDLDDDGNDVR